MNLKTGLIILCVVIVLAIAGFSAYKSFHQPGDVHPGIDEVTTPGTQTGGGAALDRGSAEGKSGLQKMPGG